MTASHACKFGRESGGSQYTVDVTSGSSLAEITEVLPLNSPFLTSASITRGPPPALCAAPFLVGLGAWDWKQHPNLSATLSPPPSRVGSWIRVCSPQPGSDPPTQAREAGKGQEIITNHEDIPFLMKKSSTQMQFASFRSHKSNMSHVSHAGGYSHLSIFIFNQLSHAPSFTKPASSLVRTSQSLLHIPNPGIVFPLPGLDKEKEGEVWGELLGGWLNP